MRRLTLVLVVALAACAGARPKPSPAAAEAPAPAPAAPAAEGTAALADRSRVPVPGPPPALKVPPQRKFQLTNGLRVRVVEHHELPIVALHLVVDAGAVHDPPDRPGLASFTAAMLTEGTRRRSATRISDDLGFIGASLSAAASFDAASLSGSVLSSHLAELLDLFADVLVNPAFPPADFARVQDQRLVSLIQQRDKPGVVASKAFDALYWGGHPYGHWPQGTERSVKATRRRELARFHATRWTPGASELVVVGDVSEGDLRGKLERALAGWRGAAPKAKLSAALPPRRPQALLVPKRGRAPQTYVLMGMPGIARSSPEYVPVQVASEVLGGGMSSRLFRDLREKEGYTYGIYARSDARKLGGASVIVGSVKADVTGAATRGLLRQIALLRDEPVPPAELAVARNSLLLSLPADFSLIAGIAGKLAEEIVYGLPDDYWERYAARLATVSSDDVLAAARRAFDPARLTTVMVCDPALVQPQLRGLPLGKIAVRATTSGAPRAVTSGKAAPPPPPTAGSSPPRPAGSGGGRPPAAPGAP